MKQDFKKLEENIKIPSHIHTREASKLELPPDTIDLQLPDTIASLKLHERNDTGNKTEVPASINRYTRGDKGIKITHPALSSRQKYSNSSLNNSRERRKVYKEDLRASSKSPDQQLTRAVSKAKQVTKKRSKKLGNRGYTHRVTNTHGDASHSHIDDDAP